MTKVGIVFVVEHGDLEQKAILLVQSIRQFGRLPSEVSLFAVKPRRSKRITNRTKEIFLANNVEYIGQHLNKDYTFYPLANKIVTAAYLEKTYGQALETIAFLDSDLLITGSLSELLSNTKPLTVKTEEKLNVGLRPNEQPTLFWEMIYENCGITDWKKVWTITSLSEGKDMQALFNPSVVVKRSQVPFYQQWLENFEKVMCDKRLFKISFFEFYFIELAVFSATAVQMFEPENFNLIDHRYNYPLHLHDSIKNKQTNLSEIAILHYHDMFENSDWTNGFEINSEMNEWLKSHVHQKRYKKTMVSRMSEILAFQVHKLKHKY